MMRSLLVTLFFCLPLAGFAAPQWEGTSDYIIRRYIQDMRKAGLQLYQYHLGGADDGVLLSVDFRLQYSPDIAQARVIFVNSLENLLYRLNSSPRARHYAPHGNFTSDNIRLSIDFRSPSGVRYGGNFVTYVVNSERGVVYCTYDPDPNNINHMKVVFREPYHYADKLAQVRY